MLVFRLHLVSMLLLLIVRLLILLCILVLWAYLYFINFSLLLFDRLYLNAVSWVGWAVVLASRE